MRSERQITFGEFRLDVVNECLWRRNQSIPLRPKAFAVLKYLVECGGQLVTKQQLLDAVWSDTFVTDAVLKDCIRQLRTTLEDDVASPRFIETAHRRGYRFIAQISEDSAQNFTQSSEPEISINENFEEHPKYAYSGAGVVGRAAELAEMRSWLDRTLRGERQIVFVTGEPGIGKTTLVEAFLQILASGQQILIGRGQCLEQYGEGEAYLPVLEAISRLGRESESRSFVNLLYRLAPTWLAQMPSLISALESEALARQMAGASRERMLREMAETLETLSEEKPLILLLEDLHWSDYSTLDLISYLARRREPARLMIIGTYRPVEIILSEHPLKGIKRELQMHRLCQELTLDYLTKEAVAEYLAGLFPEHQFSSGMAALIHHRTEGNPLFMVNVIDYLLDRQIIVEQQGKWQLEGELHEIELGVPENIRHLIEKQIERLDCDERRVMEGASVVGMDCSAEAISAGIEEDIVKIEEICDRLARNHQFLLPAYLAELPDGTMTPRYRFIHVLFLDVLYEHIAATRRSRIHQRVGERGEEVYGSRVGEIAAELAVHFEQGRDWNRAVKYLQIAAENASRRFAHHEASALALRGLELLETLPEDAQRDAQEFALRKLLESKHTESFESRF
jgi:predicted ATPase/DNA-binding winged helix-turn-helix (wHTH) protein